MIILLFRVPHVELDPFCGRKSCGTFKNRGTTGAKGNALIRIIIIIIIIKRAQSSRGVVKFTTANNERDDDVSAAYHEKKKENILKSSDVSPLDRFDA